MRFRRLFSQTMYKNLKLFLAEMTFTKDFSAKSHGDLYPLVSGSDDLQETVVENRYMIKQGSALRMFTGFFPYATYEVTFDITNGCCGFSFHLPIGKVSVTYNGALLSFDDEKECLSIPLKQDGNVITMVVSCRPSFFDVYFVRNGQPLHIHTFSSETFCTSHLQSNFEHGFAALSVKGSVTVYAVSSYIDCGISQADIRPIRYENGDVMLENGKIYLTVSVRMQEEAFQGVLSWVPSTSQFELVGAIFYDCGDGLWCGDVAASILYHREQKQWLLWVCAFSHGHILGHASFRGDPRFGLNVIDLNLMDKASPDDDPTSFLAFVNDEDPDFYYDEIDQKWYMAVCRTDPETRQYQYLFFASDHPFNDYTYIGRGYEGVETGGSFVTLNGEKIFACGNDYHLRSNYRIYSKKGMSLASFDFPDGGFRGWGTIIPVRMGTRTRVFWLTFDRHNGSDYGWSYGNIYGFEMIE